MAFTPIASGSLPNLVDVTKRLDPDGSIAKIGELLTQINPILADIPMVEGNLPTGHRITVRADTPSPSWRKLNYGVSATKSHTAQVDDTIGMLEDWGEVDKDLADLNGNTAEFRLSEDMPHIEGMSNAMATTLFYGDTITYPDRFHGFAPRYAALGSPTGKPTAQTNSAYLTHVLNNGGTTATKQTSIWYVVWGENTVFGIYPKGSQGGLIQEDLGLVTLQDNDGGKFRGYQSHYQWKMGLCVKDWRYVVRIANIELANMLTATDQKLLWQNMIKAMYAVPQTTMGNGVFYASPAIMAMLTIAATEKSNVSLGFQEAFGQQFLSFGGVPVRSCNAILETEAVLT